MSDIPLNFSDSGPIPTPPSDLRDALIAGVTAERPGYTANLPGILIEDISSTEVGGLVMMDQARIDAVNNLTPYAANPYVLKQQGQMLGVKQGKANNGSVYVVFQGPAGYVILPGFKVSDGTNQFYLLNGGTIQSSGFTQSLLAIATNPGSFSIPANSVNIVITSIPIGYEITVNNPTPGTPSKSAESIWSYRSRILEASHVTSQGTATFIKSMVKEVAGVDPRLVAVKQAPGGWKVIAGGSGDPYAIAGAIYRSVIDLSTIKGSLNSDRNISRSIIDPPDSYDVVFVNPVQQTVSMDIIWNTNLPYFSSDEQVNQLTASAILSDINGTQVTQPINILEIQNTFLKAASAIIEPVHITSLAIVVKINGVVKPPNAGTYIIPGDPEGYFFAPENAIIVNRG